MKLSFLVGAAVGYVLGARAGRGRYESIVRATHTITGSQTVQATAGVLQVQFEEAAAKARTVLAQALGQDAPPPRQGR